MSIVYLSFSYFLIPNKEFRCTLPSLGQTLVERHIRFDR